MFSLCCGALTLGRDVVVGAVGVDHGVPNGGGLQAIQGPRAGVLAQGVPDAAAVLHVADADALPGKEEKRWKSERVGFVQSQKRDSGSHPWRISGGPV